MAAARIYLTGHVAIELGDRLVSERELPGRQGRLAFVFLVSHRHRPIGRSELCDVLWPDEPPRETEAALSAIFSKLRRLLKSAAGDVDVCSGSVSLRLPPDTWVDVEAVAHETDEAEGALRAGHLTKAWGHANVAVTIGRRPLLPDFARPGSNRAGPTFVGASRAACAACQQSAPRPASHNSPCAMRQSSSRSNRFAKPAISR